MKSLQKGLAPVDGVGVITGPVGVGKTTVVNRALQSIAPGRMVSSVGRMSLAPDEVLELLLTGFGISRKAKGTIQRFAAFRRLLTERAAAGAQIAIVVEDAQRVGLDALVELEELTAADSGDATGANIILMGQPELNDWLKNPALARLRQRTRLRQSVEPFNAPEVQGYLRHSIRAAGGNFDSIFDGSAVDMLYRCSEGIPRVINNLCESALNMAADEGAGLLTAEFIQQVASDALGIEVALAPAAKVPGVATEPGPEPAATPDGDFAGDSKVAAAPVEAEPVAAPKREPKGVPKVEPKAVPKVEPKAVPKAEPEPAVSTQPDIESTQPQKILAQTVDRPDVIDNHDDDEIPRELTFEVEQTARMQAINADMIVQAEKEGTSTAEDPVPIFKAAPMITVDKDTKVSVKPETTLQPKTKPEHVAKADYDDLPILSPSMRIDAPTPAPP